MPNDPGNYAFMTQAQKDALAPKPAGAPTDTVRQPPTPPAPATTTLAEDQARAANQPVNHVNKPGYDVLGNPIPGYTPPATPSDTTAGKNTNGTYTYDASGLNAANADLQAVNDEMSKAAKTFSDTVTGFQNGSIPLTASDNAQIDGLKNQYQQLIDQQLKINQGAMGVAQVRGAQKGAAEYDMNFQANVINSVASAGLQKVASLQAEEASKVAELTDALKSKDIANIKIAYDALAEAQKNSRDNLKDAITNIQNAVAKAQEQQQKNTDALNTMAQDVLKSTGDAKLAAQISSAGSMSAAIALAGDSLQTSTDKDISGYLFYKHQSEATGVTPKSFSDWKAAQDKAALALKQQQAYVTALGTAQGQMAGGIYPETASDISAAGGLGADGKGGSILVHTGLSVAAFNYLTQGVSSMSRMPPAQRNMIMNEAQNWLNKNGVDISTFQSQYKALNDVLGANLARANRTKIMGSEATQTADALIEAITANGGNAKDPLASVHGARGMSPLRATNVLDIMAGKETNSPFATTYSTQLNILANDVAGYLAASRGATSPDDSDKEDAARIISNGMNSGSLTAFRNALTTNENKTVGVVNQSVIDTRKQVWELFGVADKFSPGTPSADSTILQDQQQAQSKIDEYVAANPDKADTIANLYDQGYTDEQMAEYLSL